MSEDPINKENDLDAGSTLDEINGAPSGKPPDTPGGTPETAGVNNGKAKLKKWLPRIFILLLLIVILLLVLKQCGVFDDKTPAPIVAGDLFPEGNAEDGPLSGMTKEEILEQMQKEADKAYFSFKINTEIVFKDGSSEGNLGIENPNNNV